MKLIERMNKLLAKGESLQSRIEAKKYLKKVFFLILREDTPCEMYPVYLTESYAQAQSQLAILQGGIGNVLEKRFHLQAFIDGKPRPLEDALVVLAQMPVKNEAIASAETATGYSYLVCSGITGGSYIPLYVCQDYMLAKRILEQYMKEDLAKTPKHTKAKTPRQYYPDEDTDFWVDHLSGQAGTRFFTILKFQAGHMLSWLDETSFWHEAHR